MSCYYVGYVGGSIGTPRLVHRVGHIRVFAAFTAVASVTILLQGVLVDATVWSALRLLSGFCFAGIYVVAESWLNDHASNQNRGTLLSVYMLILYAGLGGGQFLLTAADPASTRLFIVISVLISLAVVPMTLSVQRAPQFELPKPTGFSELFGASPLGVVGVIASGMITSALFSMGPVYAQLIGLHAGDIALFMGLSILAAVLTQLPIGRWSDRIDRRTVLIVICIVGAAAAVLAALFGRESNAMLYLLTAAFGGIALTLYSLALSHINDQLSPAQMVGASGTVVLMNGAGAIVGPALVALFMQWLGAASYFVFLACMTFLLAAYGIYRKTRRAPVPSEQKNPFVNAQPQAVSGQVLADIAAHPAPRVDAHP
jgi:MFS family permease